MVELDEAGNTTILYKLTLGKLVTTILTIGFNVETRVQEFEFHSVDEPRVNEHKDVCCHRHLHDYTHLATCTSLSST